MAIEQWKIAESDSGLRLPEALFRRSSLHLPSLKQARRLIESGRCSVNGRIRQFASATVHKGDLIEVTLGEAKKQRLECPIIYEDEWILVVNKSPGITVEKESIERIVKKNCFLVHRIDKDTSGLLLLAKDPATCAALESLFRERTVTKTYIAIVDGEMKKKHGTIQRSMKLKKRIQGGVCWGVTDDPSGKEAFTEFSCIAAKKDVSLVALAPKTGRTHQLRVHMASILHPILGDYQYADLFRCSLRPERQFLHAWKLSLPHPVSGENMSWTAPLPEDMGKAAKMLFGVDVVRKLCALY